jgi:hypothetical protein
VHAAGFEGLAQALQRAAVEFGQLVQEQQSVVGQRDLAGAQPARGQAVSDEINLENCRNLLTIPEFLPRSEPASVVG